MIGKAPFPKSASINVAYHSWPSQLALQLRRQQQVKWRESGLEPSSQAKYSSCTFVDCVVGAEGVQGAES